MTMSVWNNIVEYFKAGIGTDQLILALEPEAASIYCQFCHPPNQDHDTSFDAFRQMVKDKRKYMVVDLGGKLHNLTVIIKKYRNIVTKMSCYLCSFKKDLF